MTTHFNDVVAQAIRDKLAFLATMIKDDFISDAPGLREAYGCPNMEEIYGYHVSGFIPFQLGGYSITEFYRFDEDTSYHFTAAQSALVEKLSKQMWHDFLAEHKLPSDTGYDDLTPEQQTMMDELEREYFEPALLRAQVWVDGRTDMETDVKLPETIHIGLYLAYSDTPYYRSNKDDETLLEYTIPLAEFEAVELADIVKKLTAATS